MHTSGVKAARLHSRGFEWETTLWSYFGNMKSRITFLSEAWFFDFCHPVNYSGDSLNKLSEGYRETRSWNKSCPPIKFINCSHLRRPNYPNWVMQCSAVIFVWWGDRWSLLLGGIPVVLLVGIMLYCYFLSMEYTLWLRLIHRTL